MHLYAGKHVLFITTKNLDYLRNTQEIAKLRESAASVDVLGSSEKSYARRLLHVYGKLSTMSLKQYDTIFVGFAPQLILPLFGWRFRKKTVVIDFFISVYDTMIQDRKKWKDGSMLAKFCHWIDRSTLRKADRIISDTNAHGDYFAKEFDINRAQIETWYLCADRTIFYPRPQKKPAELQDKFVVLYFGSVQPVQGVDVIMQAMQLFANDPRIHFDFIGPIAQKVKKAEGDNITYINWLSQPELAEAISRADLCLAGHFNRENGKANRTIPGKAYIYEAMEKPMILGDSPANHERYSASQEGITFVEMGDPEALRNAILSCMEQWQKKSQEN